MIPRVPNKIKIPAIKTPREMAKILLFLLRNKSQDKKEPVQAPVPGRGIATKKVRAKNPQTLYLFSNLLTFFWNLPKYPLKSFL